MKLHSVLAAASALGLVTAPVVAQAAPRNATPIVAAESIEGNPWIPLFAGLLVILGIILVLSDDDNPASP
jgi:hypothetical protein